VISARVFHRDGKYGEFVVVTRAREGKVAHSLRRIPPPTHPPPPPAPFPVMVIAPIQSDIRPRHALVRGRALASAIK